LLKRRNPSSSMENLSIFLIEGLTTFFPVKKDLTLE